MSISERATAVRKPIRVKCPCCDASFELGGAGKPRSPEQHRRFFAMVRAVFHHWPESHETQFSDETECRKWLTMAAGERTLAMRMPVAGMNPSIAVMVTTAALRAAGSHAKVVAHKGELCVWMPKSIRFDKMSHLAFCALNDAVDAVIRAETGLDPDQLLKQTEAAA